MNTKFTITRREQSILQPSHPSSNSPESLQGPGPLVGLHRVERPGQRRDHLEQHLEEHELPRRLLLDLVVPELRHQRREVRPGLVLLGHRDLRKEDIMGLPSSILVCLDPLPPCPQIHTTCLTEL